MHFRESSKNLMIDVGFEVDFSKLLEVGDYIHDSISHIRHPFMRLAHEYLILIDEHLTFLLSHL